MIIANLPLSLSFLGAPDKRVKAFISFNTTYSVGELFRELRCVASLAR